MLRKPQYIPNMQLPSSTLGGWHATPTPPLGLSFSADTLSFSTPQCRAENKRLIYVQNLIQCAILFKYHKILENINI